MGVLHTIALVANTTSRIPFATGEWRGHFKNVGMYSRRIAYRDSCYMNKQVSRILEKCTCFLKKCKNSYGITRTQYNLQKILNLYFQVIFFTNTNLFIHVTISVSYPVAHNHCNEGEEQQLFKNFLLCLTCEGPHRRSGRCTRFHFDSICVAHTHSVPLQLFQVLARSRHDVSSE